MCVVFPWVLNSMQLVCVCFFGPSACGVVSVVVFYLEREYRKLLSEFTDLWLWVDTEAIDLMWKIYGVDF